MANPPAAAGAANARSWRGLWRMPALLLSAALLVWALADSAKPSPEEALELALADVRRSIESGDAPAAFARLAGPVEEILASAPEHRLAGFHAAIGDSVLSSIEESGHGAPATLERGVYHALRAKAKGWEFPPAQLLRLCGAEAALGREESAANRLAAMAQSSDERAIEDQLASVVKAFDEAIAPNQTEELMAILARADALAEQGEHAGSQAEFARLADALAAQAHVPPDVVDQALRSLSDCHDRVLVSGDPLLAREYLGMAGRFGPLEELPAGVLERIGSTNRLCSDGAAGPEAREYLNDAANAWLALAKSLRHELAREDEWLRTAWAAADCFDAAGEYSTAADLFATIRAWRSLDDSRGLAAAARQAQCLIALNRPDEAIALYEAIVSSHPNHPIATACRLFLSRAYELAGMPHKAEAELRMIVEGRTPLTPDSLEYREALIALAAFYDRAGRFREAVEEYSAALSRYPEDARCDELRLRLAESFLANATQIEGWLAVTKPARDEHELVASLRDEQLREALRLFESQLVTAGRVWALEGAAECASQLGEHEQAIAYLEMIVEENRGKTDRAIAQIAISNSYIALGRPEEAASARARVPDRRADVTTGMQTDEWRVSLYASLWSNQPPSDIRSPNGGVND